MTMGKRSPRFDKKKKAKYIAEFARTGRRMHCAAFADVAPATVIDHVKKDPEFAKGIEEAQESFAESLEQEATRRARDGIPRFVVQKGEVVQHDGVPLVEHHYSDTLMSQQLKAAKPSKYRENQTIVHEGEFGVLLVTAKDASEIAANREALRKASLEGDNE